MATPSSGASFATPLPQSPRSDILEWRFPKPYHQYVLTGRSRAAWHTSFTIPQLNLLLDAGLVVSRLRPKHVFLTHGHSDHTLLTSVYVSRDDPPDIYCPAEMKAAVNDSILSQTMLNLGGHLTTDDAASSEVPGAPAAAPRREDPDDRVRSPAESALLDTHRAHGLRDGDVVPLRRVRGITAAAFDCHHTVPCLGYVFSSTTHRLRPEHASLPGPELRRLRQEEGVELTAPHTVPVFAFLGDTTAATLAADPPWLRAGVPVVVTECSFLYPEHKAQADRTKHTAWSDLEPVVRRWPQTTFVLIHFSMRYRDPEVAAFFRDMPDCPSNIVVWADPEPS